MTTTLPVRTDEVATAPSSVSRWLKKICARSAAGMSPSGRLGAAILQTMAWAGPICADKKILEAGPRCAPRIQPGYVNLFRECIEKPPEASLVCLSGWYPL